MRANLNSSARRTSRIYKARNMRCVFHYAANLRAVICVGVIVLSLVAHGTTWHAVPGCISQCVIDAVDTVVTVGSPGRSVRAFDVRWRASTVVTRAGCDLPKLVNSQGELTTIMTGTVLVDNQYAHHTRVSLGPTTTYDAPSALLEAHQQTFNDSAAVCAERTPDRSVSNLTGTHDLACAYGFYRTPHTERVTCNVFAFHWYDLYTKALTFSLAATEG